MSLMYTRRFTTEQSADVLLNIESVNILDLDPRAQIVGAGTGTACCIGEFEDGPFNTATAVMSSNDVAATFGSLGYTYDGVVASYPCAKSRLADNAIVAEYWNGNGMAQLNGKSFSALQIVRVNTSVGNVVMQRLASVYGANSSRFNLTASGQILSLDVGSGATSATFTGVAGTVTAVGGTYPSLFAGGETLTLGWDDQPNVVIGFTSADSLLTDVINRINATVGFTFASNASSQIKLTGRIVGTAGNVRVVAASAAGVLTKLGFTVATTNGTGNVANLNQVTVAEVKTITEAAIANTLVEVTPNGRLRVSNKGTPLTGTITVGPLTTAAGLGFTIGTVGTANIGVATTIPAGTVLRNAGSTAYFVTMQSQTVPANGVGPYTIPVRHAVDDTTGVLAAPATIVVVDKPNEDAAWVVSNTIGLSAALTENQIDAAYQTAFDATLAAATIAKKINIIWSARQSNAIRQMGRNNAITASSSGLQGRVFCARTPMNALKAIAVGTTSYGVGVTRDERTLYCYPQFSTYIPAIARRGTAGGVGFTATGIVDVGADGFLASILSQLAPEENPGQSTDFLIGVSGLESGANVQGFQMPDYQAFKLAGICSPRIDEGEVGFQSGVTSVDPSVLPNRKNIARRRMADYIQDSMVARGKAYGKKLNTPARRRALASEVKVFLSQLLAKEQPSQSRIAGYTLDAVNGNTPDLIAKGMFRLNMDVQTYSSMDSIVFATTIGESVSVVEKSA